MCLDTLNLFSQPVGVLIFDPTQMVLYDTKSNTLYRDREVWNMMYRTFGTVFDFRDYVSVFAGKIPRLASLHLTEIRWNPETGNYQVTALDSERKDPLEIEVNTQSLLPVKLARWEGENRCTPLSGAITRKRKGACFHIPLP